MRSQLLMLDNISQPFIRVKDKSLSYSTTDKGRTKVVFVGKTMLGSVFMRYYADVFSTIRVGNIAWSEVQIAGYKLAQDLYDMIVTVSRTAGLPLESVLKIGFVDNHKIMIMRLGVDT